MFIRLGLCFNGAMTQTFGDQLVELLPRLRRFAISLCGSRERADELVQTACAKALAAQASWTPGTRFDSWMFRILRNTWIDVLRRQRVEGPPADSDGYAYVMGSDGEETALSRLTLQAVWTAIGSLPVEQREVLLLVAIEGFTYGEAAEVLGIPVGTVMSRLARGREKIAEAAGIDRKNGR